MLLFDESFVIRSDRVSGCKHLLVLAGETYATRLWCVLELFVFLKLGGSRERIVFKSFGGHDSAMALARFDCENARCYHMADREMILAVIETGFGDTVPFNRTIRNLLSEQQGASRANAFVEVDAI